MGLTAFGLIPVAVAFFGAAALVMLTGALPMREAYEHVEWPILIMLGALNPVSEALQTTGGPELNEGWLTSVAAVLPGLVGLDHILLTALAVIASLNHHGQSHCIAPMP